MPKTLQIIPAINCEEHNGDGVVDRLRVIEQFAEWVHLDVADGVFTFSKSWGNPPAWHELDATTKLEVHIMVEHPEQVAADWINAGAKRVIVHYEAFPKTKANPEKLRKAAFAEIIERAHHAGAEVFLAINPETTLAMAAPHLSKFDGFQIFAQAHPGPSGQVFLPSVLPKIEELRRQFPNATIEVDGGMNRETAAQVVRAGANAIVAGSYILHAPDPKAAYEELCSLA